jgi:hypothetical protein
LKIFLSEVAREVQGTGRRLVIGIDELDRIEPIQHARDFLNELKIVFDMPDCLFVLSVSDEALREADLAQPGRRDAFDSAIDEVVRVEPLTYEYAVRLLGTRAIGLPEPFTALFHCLSGGLPRDLLRTARAVNASHLVALVCAGATFKDGKLIERPDDQPRPAAAQPGGMPGRAVGRVALSPSRTIRRLRFHC